MKYRVHYSRFSFIRTHWSKRILSELRREMGLFELSGYILMVLLYPVLSSCVRIKRLSGQSGVRTKRSRLTV